MNPILKNLPEKIETQRLSIEITRPGEGTEVNQAILDSFEELHKWMPWAPKKPTIDESEISIRQAYARWILREEFRFSLRVIAVSEIIDGLEPSVNLASIDWQKFEQLVRDLFEK